MTERPNPLFDNSRWTLEGAREQRERSVHDVLQGVLRDENLTISVVSLPNGTLGIAHDPETDTFVYAVDAEKPRREFRELMQELDD